MKPVLVLGSCGTDFTLRLPRLPRPGETLAGDALVIGPGGKGANPAVAARRAGPEVTFVTALGDDEFGRRWVERYRAEGIEMTHARLLAGVGTGTALIFLGSDGQNAIGIHPAANARLSAEMVEALPETLFQRGGVFLACLEIPISAVRAGLMRARSAGMITVLNPAPADAAIGEEDTLSFVDILTPNQEEALTLTECADGPSAAEGMCRRGAGASVVTLGAEGVFWARSSREPHKFPAYSVSVVDTVGAGDAFNGALATALAEGRDLEAAIRWASAAAALSVMEVGAQGGLPQRSRIERLFESRP